MGQELVFNYKKAVGFYFRGGVCFSGGFFNGADDIVSVLLERTMVYALVVFVYFSECHGIDFTGVRDFKPVVLVFPYAQKTLYCYYGRHDKN